MVYHCFTDVWIWASLGKAGIRKSRTTLGDRRTAQFAVADKGSIDDGQCFDNCAVADKASIDKYYRELDKAGIRKWRTTLGDILGLHNCAVADKGSIDDGQCLD